MENEKNNALRILWSVFFQMFSWAQLFEGELNLSQG